jgi:hypothetical protein
MIKNKLLEERRKHIPLKIKMFVEIQYQISILLFFILKYYHWLYNKYTKADE